jgi:predicted extracellular nuclease
LSAAAALEAEDLHMKLQLHAPHRCRRAAITRAVLAALALPLATAAGAQNIGTLQGSAHLSTLANTNVTGVTGIVTALAGNGFWMQDAGDANPLTSDAIFVFRNTASKPVIGDSVSVNGLLQEFRPGSDPTNLTVTQINATSGAWTRLSAGNALPAALSISGSFLPPTAIAPGIGNVETGHTLQPTLYSMDFYESMEGMRVTLPSAVSSGPTNNFRETWVTVPSQASQPGVFTSSRGGVVLGAGQFNGHRIQIDDGFGFTAPASLNSGAVLSNVTGVISYSFNNYELLLTAAPTTVSNSLVRETVTIPTGRFGLASYNVENLGGNAGAARFTAIAGQIAGTLGAPHLISLQEIQDNNGATNNGVVAADVTLNSLAGALNTATGRSYAWVSVTPSNNTDGGQTGGNIRQAFMYDSARVSFSGVVGAAADAMTASADANGQIVFNLGAGRVDPGNSAWASSRKPLVTEFTVDGQQLIVIANHFNSKGGDEPLYGPNQPPNNVSEVQRLQQAQVLGSFVAGLLAINPHANIVVTGDLNDFQFADTLAPLAAAGLTNMTNTLAANERYTYAYQGNLQTLDHMWVSGNLLANGGALYDVVHANAEFFDQVSDHDPILLTLSAIPVTTVPEPQSVLMMLMGALGVFGAVRKRKA